MNSERKTSKSTFLKSTTSLPVRLTKIKNQSNTNVRVGRETVKCGSNTARTGNIKPKTTWITPKPQKTFLTKGVLSRRSQTTEFAYDLSQDERLFTRKFSGPMKALSNEEKQLQQSTTRSTYLNSRYEHAPDQKYNFPEATSWRIGWFHSQQLNK